MKFIATTLITLTLASAANAYDGLRDGEREMLDRIEARKAEDRGYNQYKNDQYQRNHVGYGDRKRIRELEMKKGELNSSLSRGSKTYGQTQAIREQIRGIDRQIQQLRSPNY